MLFNKFNITSLTMIDSALTSYQATFESNSSFTMEIEKNKTQQNLKSPCKTQQMCFWGDNNVTDGSDNLMVNS